MTPIIKIPFLLFLFLFITINAYAQFNESEFTGGTLGGPEQVDNRIAEDKDIAETLYGVGFMYPYNDFKEMLKNSIGLGYGFDYSAAYLQATDTMGWDNASSGMVRLFLAWDLVNRDNENKGGIIFKVEHRHKYTEIPPVQLSYEVGHAGEQLRPFNNDGFRLTNFYWRQTLLNGKLTFMVGLLDAKDYVDPYALSSPWTGFVNFVFGTGSQITYIPNDAALGVAVGGYVTDHIYLMAGLVDAGADPEQPWTSFQTFFTNKGYFKSVEVGFVSRASRYSVDNIHVTCWQSDGSDVTGASAGWGMAFSATWFFGNKWLPFIRGGFARDGGSLYQKSISVGFGYQPIPKGSVLGLGLNWGEPNESTLSKGLRQQYTFEMYYRAQITSRFAITPDAQILINPAFYTSADAILLWGFRARLSL